MMDRAAIDALARDLAEVLAHHLGATGEPTREPAQRPTKTTWATPWCDLWSEAMGGGKVPGARIAAAVGPLRQTASDSELIDSFRVYLERTPKEFASPQHWASRWRIYLEPAAPLGATRARDTAQAVAVAVLRRGGS